jgi:hypothetical protein
MRGSPWCHNKTFYPAIAPILGTARPAQDLNPFLGWLNLIVNTAMCEHAVVGIALRPTVSLRRIAPKSATPGSKTAAGLGRRSVLN